MRMKNTTFKEPRHSCSVDVSKKVGYQALHNKNIYTNLTNHFQRCKLFHILKVKSVIHMEDYPLCATKWKCFNVGKEITIHRYGWLSRGKSWLIIEKDSVGTSSIMLVQVSMNPTQSHAFCKPMHKHYS